MAPAPGAAEPQPGPGRASGAQARLGRELQWYVWNVLWQSANAVRAARSTAPERGEKLRRLDEDTARVHRHLANIQALGGFPAEALARLGREAELAGRRAALAAPAAAAAPAPAPPAAPPGLAEGLWPELLRAIELGADVVAGVVRDARPVVQQDFEECWHHLHAHLPLVVGEGMSENEAERPGPEALGRDLRWYAWNLAWGAANAELAAGAQGRERERKLASAEEDRRRGDEHLSRLQALGAGPLGRLRRRAEAAGRAAAAAALARRPPAAEELAGGAAPGGLEAAAAEATGLGALAVAELLLEERGCSRREGARALEAEFGGAWARLCAAWARAPAGEGARAEARWYLWNLLWAGANARRAAGGSAGRREERLRRAEEDRQRAAAHLRAAGAPAALRELGRRAELVGGEAAAAVLAEGPLLASALGAAGAAESGAECPAEAEAALLAGARAVAEALLGEVQPSRAERARALEARCKEAWRRLASQLPSLVPELWDGAPVQGPGAALDRLPTHVGGELKWFVWNVLWRAANSEAGTRGREHGREEKLQRAKDDAKRSEEHLELVQTAKILPPSTLRHLEEQADTFGRAAAAAANRGRPWSGEDSLVALPPKEIGPGLWSGMIEAMRLGAAAAAETLLDEYSSAGDGYASQHATYAEGRMLQERFEEGWHELFRKLPRTAALDANAASFVSNLKWMAWNEMWRAANAALAEAGPAHGGDERARKAEEDGRRSGVHRDKALSRGLLTAEAAAALEGSPLPGGGVGALEPEPAPDFRGEPERWRGLLGVLALGAGAVAEDLLEDLARRGARRGRGFRARLLQADFEVAWRRLRGPAPAPRGEPPPAGAPPAAAARGALPRPDGAAVARYRRDGCLGPLRGAGAARVRRCREGLERLLALRGEAGLGERATDGHAALPWLHELACLPEVLGAVAAVLGAGAVLLHQTIVILRSPGKSGEEETGVGWHADGFGYRNSLGPLEDFVTAFVALTPCTKNSGCLEFAPEGGGDNIFMELQPGEFSLHSATVSHRAIRNSSSQRRDCIIFRFISGSVRDLVAEVEHRPRDWAVLASGQDTEGHFRLLPPPEEECDAEGLKMWSEVSQLRKSRSKRAR